MRALTSATGNSPAPARRAFTMVEMLVVLAVVAVVAGMTVPQFVGAVGSSRLKEQACSLLVAARHARDFAITRRRDCRLVIDATGKTYRLDQKDPSPDGGGKFVPLPLEWGRAQSLATGLSFGRVQIEPIGAAGEQGCVTFCPTGEADAAIVELTDGEKYYSLLLLPPTGRAKLVQGRATALPDDREDLDAQRR